MIDPTEVMEEPMIRLHDPTKANNNDDWVNVPCPDGIPGCLVRHMEYRPKGKESPPPDPLRHLYPSLRSRLEQAETKCHKLRTGVHDLLDQLRMEKIDKAQIQDALVELREIVSNRLRELSATRALLEECQRENGELRAALEAVPEFIPSAMIFSCLSCGNRVEQGHKSDCPRQRALGKP